MPPKASSTSTARRKGKDHAKKSVPKPPLSVPERLKRLFTSLCAQIDGGHFTNAIKTCEKILRLDSEDADAKRTKLFLLLQTEQYDAALTLIESGAADTAYAYEKAYSLYRLQYEEEARAVLKDIKQEKGDEDRAILHLDAQLCYRDGSYAEAVELYNVLLESAQPDSEEYFDVSTNLQAAQKHLDFIDTGFRHVLDALPTSLVTALETHPPPTQSSNPISTTVTTLSKDPPAATPAPAEKKVRKSRVHPGVIPGVTPPPDPERWLKKSERSTYSHGKKRRGAGGGGATQGSANVDFTPSGTSASTNKPSAGKGKKKK